MASKVKKKNFYQISGWMLDLADKYDLKDKELVVYAIIYGFSQDGKSWFSGSLDYISQWIRTDRQNVYSRYIKPLLEKGLIIREKLDLTIDTSSYKYMAIVPNNISYEDNIIDNCSQNETSTHKCDGCSQNETSALKMRDNCSQNESSSALKMRNNNIYNNINNNSTSTNKPNLNDLFNVKQYELDGMLLTDKQYDDINELVQMIGCRVIDSSKDDLLRFLKKIYNKEKQTFIVNGTEEIYDLKSFIKNSFIKKTEYNLEQNKQIKSFADQGFDWAIKIVEENPKLFSNLE